MTTGDKIKERFGKDWFADIGSRGGQARVPKGFGSHKVDANGLTGPERARIAGRKGGKAFQKKKLSVGWKIHL